MKIPPKNGSGTGSGDCGDNRRRSDVVIDTRNCIILHLRAGRENGGSAGTDDYRENDLAHVGNP
jgi:hypothetical protein